MSTPTFGEQLRELRKAKDYSLRDLSIIIGTDFTYLSKLERDTPGYSPSSWLIHEFACALDANEDELIKLAGKVPPTLKEMMRGNPLLTELVRVLSEKPLPSEVYQQLTAIAKARLESEET